MKVVIAAVVGACLVLALVGVLIVGVVSVVALTRRNRPALEDSGGARPDPTARRDALLDAIEPSLDYLGAPEIERLPGGGARITGQLVGDCVFEIGRDGGVTRLRAAGTFALGRVRLSVSGRHVDPDGALAWVDADEVAALVERMREVGISELRLERDAISASVDGSLFDRDIPALTVAGLLATVLDAVSLWGQAEPETPDEAEVPASLPANPVAAAFAFDRWGDGDVDALHRAARALLFDGIEAALDKPKQVLPSGANDDAELRGRAGGIPTRLVVDDEGGFYVECRIANMEWAAFEYDTALSPISPDADDDFADEDIIRVFVAKGMFIEADPDSVEAAMQFVAGFEPAILDRIHHSLMTLPLAKIQYGVDELMFYGGTPLQEVEDPVASCRSILELAGVLGQTVGGGAKGAVSQLQCEYRKSRYFFGLSREACPNCGAPPGTF